MKTPNIDRLAREGCRFTNGYATSATCTPSRYSLITGEYALRKKGTGVLPGDAALIVPTDRAHVAFHPQEGRLHHGHRRQMAPRPRAGKELIDWNGEIKPGPREVGFDYSFIMAATGDRVPCVYIENQRIVGLDRSDPIQVSYDKPFPGEPTGDERPRAS